MRLHLSAAWLVILLYQWQVASALPLPRWSRTAAGDLDKTSIPHHPGLRAINARFWEAQVADERRETAEETPTTQPPLPSIRRSHHTPRDALPTADLTSRRLDRRADSPVGSSSFTTGLFAALIVVSVLLGMGIASIAVFGFEWKLYFAKSRYDRKEIEKEERRQGKQPMVA